MDEQLLTYLNKAEHASDSTLNLIASENYPSKEVLLPLTSVVGAKYAEGYPGKRYYGGCQTVDEIELLAIKLACELFHVQYANVQPHSGSNANLAAFFALLNVGDNVLAPAMDSGGHLTHGSSASVTSELWAFTHYHVDSKTGLFDYDEIAKLAHKTKPKLIIAGTSAYPQLIDWERMRTIADQVDAVLLADIAHLAGLIAGGAIPSPFPYAHIATSTTQKTLRGPRGGLILTNDKSIAQRIDQAVFPALQGGPHAHTIAAKAQAFSEAMDNVFAEYSTQTIRNAQALASALRGLGCKLWGETPETHLFNMNTQSTFGMGGKEAEQKLEQVGIIVNRECLPGDTKPLTPSGIRIGTPALTTRGMREAQMKKIAELIVGVLRDDRDVKNEIANLCRLFPL